MGVYEGETFTSRGIYLNYDFEAVTYRWDHRTVLIYVHFYDTVEYPEPAAYHNRLFNDALRFGREISHEEYERGFPLR